MKRRVLLFLLFLLAIQSLVFAKQPRLIVSIVIDQFRYDYLTRFDASFSKNGFKRLMDGGAFMTYAHYDYAHTLTGPGHATYLSCTPPSVHGIIGNGWYDRAIGRRVNCVSDRSVTSVGSNTENGEMSPRYFLGSSFADELLMANNFHSRIISIAIKDRAAILPAGKRPTGVYWFDHSTGDFITSSYYAKVLPKWAADFNLKKPAEKFLGTKWEKLLPEKDYDVSDSDAGHGEGRLPGDSSSQFPHVIVDLEKKSASRVPRYLAFLSTPFANELTIDFAKAAVLGEKLGRNDDVDLLLISFSANDYCGHIFGPNSQEVQDITVRLDRQLANFFDFLDAQVGLNNTLIILTSDHGVAPTSAYAKAMDIDSTMYDASKFVRELKSELQKELGAGRFILSFMHEINEVYLNEDLLRQKKLSPAAIQEFVGRAALSRGIQFYFTRADLLKGEAAGRLGRLVLNGFNPARSGDVVLIPKPYDRFTDHPNAPGTTHGSPFNYDTHVPIIFYGKPFKPGRYPDEVHITDIVPTLTSVLGIQEPAGCIGKPITKILE